MNDRAEKQPLVFVGLSGGVDSSVAAARLIDQGYKVVGVFIKVWQPDFLKCDWEAERLDAMRVAAHLKIPFLTCDAEAEYKKEVGDYFVSEYLAGRTPNPDVLCNRHVKFGAFAKFAKEHGADYLATGHYARVLKTDEGYKLLRGVDTTKDQSYFLWTLTQEDLARVLFPVGDTPKEEIREEAKKRNLPTAIKKDSQGICFLGHIDIKEFLSHFTTLVPGIVLDTHGNEIGTHDGALIYTLGQRHGFKIEGPESTKPHYVVSKDMSSNVLIVDTKPPVLREDTDVHLENISIVSSNTEFPKEVGVQFRYRQEPVNFVVKDVTENSITLSSPANVDKPAAGQSAVFYNNDECLGGGVVK